MSPETLTLHEVIVAAGFLVFRPQFSAATARDEIANPVELARRSVGMIMAGKHRPDPGFLEKWMESLRPELVIRRRDALRFPDWEMKKDEDRTGLRFLEIASSASSS